jgi:hypothetical protein
MRHALRGLEPPVLRTRRAFAALVTVIGCGALASCGGGGATAAKLPSCVQAPAGIGPDAGATLQLADLGHTVCLRHGEVLTVFLAAPVGEPMWASVTSANRKVLAPRSSGVMTLVRGVTGAVFAGGDRGVTELTSTRPPCAAGGANAKQCDASHGWYAKVVVTG